MQVNIIVVLSSLFFWQPQTCHMTGSRCNWYMMSHLIIELVLIAILTNVECLGLFLSHNSGQLSLRKNKLLTHFCIFLCILSKFLVSHTLGCQINEYTRLFGTKDTWRKKQTQRQTRVFNENPPYSFIWPYSFNWHLRVRVDFCS